MKEKYVWELWNKCKHPDPKYGGGDMVWPIEFAELIVKECIEELEASMQCDPYTGQTSHADDEVNAIISNNIEAIKEHFGIE